MFGWFAASMAESAPASAPAPVELVECVTDVTALAARNSQRVAHIASDVSATSYDSVSLSQPPAYLGSGRSGGSWLRRLLPESFLPESRSKRETMPPERVETPRGRRLTVFPGHRTQSSGGEDKGMPAGPKSDSESSSPGGRNGATLGAAGSSNLSHSYRRMESRKATRSTHAGQFETPAAREMSFKPKRVSAPA